jgi:anhydro-N-acetylmuramic acid kinase
MRTIRVLGVMTGPSCDGLDASCVELGPNAEGGDWSPLWSRSKPFPAALRRRVLAAQRPGVRVGALEWMELHRDLGEWYGKSLAAMLAGARRSRLQLPHAIANHGQTLAHFPAKGVTLQLGDPTRVARATGLTVVSGFREGDLASGGQGAPLVPAFHRLLARNLARGRAAARGVAIHNLGGISNLTYVGPRRASELLAFDTGPGNAWIDAAAEHATAGRLKMDLDGRLASRGHADRAAIRALLKHPFFRKAAPKSTGRDDFPFELMLAATRARGADLVATATALTVESLAQAYERFVISPSRPLDAIYACGGGARNPTLMNGIRRRLDRVQVLRVEEADASLDGQYVEAQAFAYLGYLALHGKPVGGPWTGSRGFAPPAHVIPGENWAELASRLRGSRSRR